MADDHTAEVAAMHAEAKRCLIEIRQRDRIARHFELQATDGGAQIQTLVVVEMPTTGGVRA